jgi:hypothetical protein
MRRYVLKKFPIGLDFQTLTDDKLGELADNIVQLAPTSPLFASPAIQASVASIKAKVLTFKGNLTKVTNDAKQLATDTTACDESRAELGIEVLALKGLTETGATKASDITSMAFALRGPKATKPPLVAPEQIDIVMPKRARGYFTAMAHEPKGSRQHFAAQISLDAANPVNWTELVGEGKSRRVSGYKSGTQVWVRFAVQRGQMRSEWSTPVLVTVP